jgi:hypothetical protein
VNYYLTAYHNSAVAKHNIYAEDDTDATFSAMRHILNSAMDDIVWAKGFITLSNEFGNVIRTMPAKD